MTRVRAWLSAGSLIGPTAVCAQDHFQQRVDYAIDVRLDDVKHELHASETFTYTNNSPQALDTLWIHLWPNAYRDRNTALCRQHDKGNDFGLHFAEAKDRGFIDSLDFSVMPRQAGASRIKLEWSLHCCFHDIAWIKFPAPLASGTSITITTPFRVKIPSARFSRLGHIDQAYYITQWYPKPAVYDRKGWHAMPYLSQGEFYSEFGSFDVSITLPENYVVGATGELQNAGERAWLDSLSKLPVADAALSQDPKAPKGKGDPFPPSASPTKTIRFLQDDVHDFAWFADKRFIVRKGEVALPRSGRKVTTWAMFTPKNAPEWAQGVEYVGRAVVDYSAWVGEYPYNACTAVDGTIAAGGGMEYPMITIIGESGDAKTLDEVIAHEVGHNWFYGILASNERDHPWMDEGVNSFCELRYMRRHYPDGSSSMLSGLPKGLLGDRTIGHRDMSELGYRFNARRNLDQSPSLVSEEFTQVNYGTSVYMKPALAFDHLFAYLGDTLFDACMHAYFDRWHHKHPYPEDMRKVFEEVSGKDLGWLFETSIASDLKTDVKARGIRGNDLLVGGGDMPFPATGWNGADSLGTVWLEAGTTNGLLPWPSVDRVRLDAGNRTLDIDHRNNEVRSHGLFKGWTKPRLKFLAGVERPDRRTAYWTPAAGYNAHDGLMAGLALYNTTFPSQRFEYALLPLYGTNSSRPVGGGRAGYHFDRLDGGPFRNVHIGGSFQSFTAYNEDDVIGEYEKWVPSVRFDLRRDLSRPVAHAISLRGVLITERTIGEQEGDDIGGSMSYTYEEVRYDMERRNGLDPFNANVTLLNGEAFTRAAFDGMWSRIFDKQKHRISFRLFAGTFFRTDDEMMEPRMGWRYHLGASDLLYDHLFIERQPIGTLTNQQITKDQGGFKTPNSYGTSDTWIAALNMELDFPFSLPLSFFASAGASPVKTVTQSGTTTRTEYQYEGGVGIRLIRDMVEVWVPLFASPDINDQLKLLDLDPIERVRFVFLLEKLDPTRMLRRAPF